MNGDLGGEASSAGNMVWDAYFNTGGPEDVVEENDRMSAIGATALFLYCEKIIKIIKKKKD